MDILCEVYRRLNARYILLLLVFLPFSLSAQINTYLRGIYSGQAKENTPLRVTAALSKSTELSRVVLYYRQFGQTEYRVMEMTISGDSASVTIAENEVAPPFMEVYVFAQTTTGTSETYPFENPMATPARLYVAARSQKDQEVVIMSPDVSEQLTPADLYISISFVYASKAVDLKKTKIFFDNTDLSSVAVSLGELLIVSADALPKTISKGAHSLKIEIFDTSGAPYHTIDRSFNLVSEMEAAAIREQIQYSADAQAEGRNEDIKGTVTQYKRLNARAKASYGILKTTGNILLTSEEQSDRQPQNRYFLGLDAKYARVGIGDAYPRFPTSVMDGRRVRGITADLLLGAFNVNFANGEIIRRVDITDTTGKVYTTFKRNLMVVRPSFGKGENFQIGFTYLKSKDGFNPLSDTTTKPQENMVVGTDALIAFDDHRIEFTGQASFSLNNVDISAPAFTETSIDSSKLTSDVKDLLKKYGLPYLSKLITLNDNLQPLPPGSTALVYETGLSFNYFGNFLKASYIYHGADYLSVGTTALRRDVEGYNIFDRLRLLENRVFLTGSYERLKNNTSGRDTILTMRGKIRLTTTYQTFNTSLSYYPSSNMPNVTIGYGLNDNKNPIDPLDTNLVARGRAIDEVTNRFFVQSTYDFSFWGRHNTTLSIDVSSKVDNTPKKQDVKSMNAFLLINTVHTFPLETALAIAMSLNTIPLVTVDTTGGTFKTITSSTTLNYSTITLHAGYNLYQDIVKLTGTVAPTLGDFKRTVLESGLLYTIAQNQSAAFQYQFIINSGTANDSYLSLLYRITL